MYNEELANIEAVEKEVADVKATMIESSSIVSIYDPKTKTTVSEKQALKFLVVSFNLEVEYIQNPFVQAYLSLLGPGLLNHFILSFLYGNPDDAISWFEDSGITSDLKKIIELSNLTRSKTF